MRQVFLGVLCLWVLLAHSKATHAQDGIATYYTVQSAISEGTSGLKTASGGLYDENAMTCAMRHRDWGTRFFVYGHETGKSVIVTLTDFGPGEIPYYQQGKIIDLTPRAFKVVCGDLKFGRCAVSVQEVK